MRAIHSRNTTNSWEAASLPPVGPFESGRRLCLLVEAGETRYAIEATSVMEVALPGSDGTSLRGMLEVKDLSTLLGGSPETAMGMVVVLDVSPTLAVRVRSGGRPGPVGRRALPAPGSDVGEARTGGALGGAHAAVADRRTQFLASERTLY
jgi:hypothetical protein